MDLLHEHDEAVALAQQALVDELVKAQQSVQKERDRLADEAKRLDGAIKEYGDRIAAITGVKRRTRVIGRSEQILAVLRGHGEPLKGSEILETLAPADKGEQGRYGVQLKKMVSLGVLAESLGMYSIAPEKK